MPQLTAANITVLNNYANAGQRERYWSYLAALGDKYAARALEVVRNDGPFGQLANNHAANAVPASRAAEFTEQRWNEFGVDLMRADLQARERLFARDTGDRGLTLPVDTIRAYHGVAFDSVGLPRTAWTLEPVIGGMLDSGNAPQQLFAQTYWDLAVSGPYGYALAMAWAPSAAVVSGGVWNAITSTVSNAYQFTQFDGRSALRNPDVIRGWSFNAATGEWSKESLLSNTAGIPYLLSPTPQETQLLNADRLYRQNRLSDPARFQRDPLDTLTPTGLRGLAGLDPANMLNPSDMAVASNLADLAAGGYYTAQASLGGGVSSGVPSSIVDAVHEQLIGRDLIRAETYRQEGIVYVDFDNGDRLTIDPQGRIATVKTESIAGVGNRTVSTDFDRNTTTFEQSVNGTSTTTQRNALNQVINSIVATESQTVVQEYAAPDTPGNRTVIDQQALATRVQVYDSSNTLQTTTISQTFDDGTSLSTTTYPSGQQSVITTATDNTSRQIDTPNPADPNTYTSTERNAAGAITSSTSITPALDDNNNPLANTYDIVQRNGAGQITSAGERVVNPITGGYVDTLTSAASPADPLGSMTQTSAASPTAPAVDQTKLAALNNLAPAVQNIIDTRALLQAWRSGNSLYAVISDQVANCAGVGQERDVEEGATDTTDLIAVCATFYWAGGLNDRDNYIQNDNFWRNAA